MMDPSAIQQALAPQFNPGTQGTADQQFGPDPMVMQQQQQFLQMPSQQQQQMLMAPQMNVQTQSQSQFVGNPVVGANMYAPYANPWSMMYMPYKYMPPPPGPAPYPFPSFNPPNYYNPSNQFVG